MRTVKCKKTYEEAVGDTAFKRRGIIRVRKKLKIIIMIKIKGIRANKHDNKCNFKGSYRSFPVLLFG